MKYIDRELNTGITTPCFFPSISSAAKNKLTPLQHLEIIYSINYPQFLISAYDIFIEQKINQQLKKCKDQYQIIMLDSGIYERTWKNDKSWDEDKYNMVLDKCDSHIIFNYDLYDSDIITQIKKSSTLTGKKLNPIIHAKSPVELVELCIKVSQKIETELIAVPERELGSGILECAENIARIRKVFDENKCTQNIHVLGTGNPLAILIYSFCGADSFDGLDWCQTVVDYKTATLHHIKQLDFFIDQSEYGNKDLSYMVTLFAHNLNFYNLWMNKIQSSLKEGNIEMLLKEYLPYSFEEKLMKRLASL